MIEIAREEALAADTVLVDRVASATGAMPAKRRVRAAAVTGATIDPEAWLTRAFLSLADARPLSPASSSTSSDSAGSSAPVAACSWSATMRSTSSTRCCSGDGVPQAPPRAALHRPRERLVPRSRAARHIARFNIIPSRRPRSGCGPASRRLSCCTARFARPECAATATSRTGSSGRDAAALRLALDAEADVVFVAALGNDEAYYQSAFPMPGALTRLVNAGDGDRYRGMRLAFGLLGPI
jgi:hypothetical protein